MVAGFDDIDEKVQVGAPEVGLEGSGLEAPRREGGDGYMLVGISKWRRMGFDGFLVKNVGLGGM